MIITSLLKAFTISKYRCHRAINIYTGLFLFVAGVLYPQQSLDFWSGVESAQNSRFRLNSFDGNIANLYYSNDWEVSALLSGSGQNAFKSNLLSISLGKHLGDHYFYARFTPGYSEEFVFNSGLQVIVNNPIRVETELQNKIRYNEEFGLGYSYRFNSSISAGITLRYFQQLFNEDQPNPVLTDSLNYILINTKSTNSNFWRGDVGLAYHPAEWITVSLSSMNLFIAEENTGISATDIYSLKKRKGAMVQARGNFFTSTESFLSYESGGNFTFGSNYSFVYPNSSITVGTTVFHDQNQFPYIAGILPSMNYSTKLYSVTLGAVKYFGNRDATKTITDLTSSGIDNLINNKFSGDKLFLGINFALSFAKEQSVRFEEVTIDAEIFPTLVDKYLTEPIAVAKIVNFSDKQVTIHPASFIPSLNEEKIYSPSVTIGAGNSASIPFFTIFSERKYGIKHRTIEQAEFYLESENETDDEIKKPILINDGNAWDGNVYNLKYFVKNDIKYSSVLAKNILSKNIDNIKSMGTDLEIFEKTRVLFNSVIKNMLYVAASRINVEVVQFPEETITLKGGNCDDLSVCFSSLLESVGIETAFVDYKAESTINHVNLIVNTGLTPGKYGLITLNDKKIIVRKNQGGNDEIWIPVETTSLTDFETAWSVASEKYESEAVEQMGLANGKVQIIDIK